MKPYTYFLFHEKTGFKYYGCQYAKNCHPSNFWVKYFTSSKKVKELIEEHGVDSFSFQIRKVFNDPVKCRIWEIKVIRRMKLVRRKEFLNQRNPGGLEEFMKKNYKPWNYGLKNDPRCANPTKGNTNRWNEEQKKIFAYKSSKEYKSIEIRKRHSEKVSGLGNPCHNKIWVNDGITEKRILSEDFLMEEYESFNQGRLKRIYINDGISEKLILPKDLLRWKNLGFVEGYLQRNRDLVSGKFLRNNNGN